MSEKFIPNGQDDFRRKAAVFAQQVQAHPLHFHLPEEEVREVVDAVAEFNSAHNASNNHSSRSNATNVQKALARARAEAAIRHVFHLVKHDRKLTDADRALLGIRPKAKRSSARPCPQSAPFLFLMTYRGMHMWTPGIHMLRFTDAASTSAKPEGAARLELFAGFLEPGGSAPLRPRPLGMGYHGYIRSYTRSPIRVEYPLSDKPMQVVYWARWANSAGETGPFSQALVTPVDGRDWSRYTLPEPEDQLSTRLRSTVIVTSAQRVLPAAEPTPSSQPA
jgi:hypothetical protein